MPNTNQVIIDYAFMLFINSVETVIPIHSINHISANDDTSGGEIAYPF